MFNLVKFWCHLVKIDPSGMIENYLYIIIFQNVSDRTHKEIQTILIYNLQELTYSNLHLLLIFEMNIINFIATRRK